jgi:hypothetical protein
MESIAFEADYESDDNKEGNSSANANAREMADDFLQVPQNKPIPPPKVVNEKAMEGMGLVGTVIVLQTSYIVWFGWGKVQDEIGNCQARQGVNDSRLLGSDQGSDSCQMGQFLVSMPPKKFPGALSTNNLETSTSKLIGGDEDDMVARQMASRLSQKSGKPVLVSCHLDTAHLQSMGLDPDLLQARASALAEQRIWKLLQDYQTGR